MSLSFPFLISLSSVCHPLFISPFFCPGSKAGPRPGGIGSAAAGQPGMEGDSMLSKMLPGSAAEQAGKLGEGTPIMKQNMTTKKKTQNNCRAKT